MTVESHSNDSYHSNSHHLAAKEHIIASTSHRRGIRRNASPWMFLEVNTIISEVPCDICVSDGVAHQCIDWEVTGECNHLQQREAMRCVSCVGGSAWDFGEAKNSRVLCFLEFCASLALGVILISSLVARPNRHAYSSIHSACNS